MSTDPGPAYWLAWYGISSQTDFEMAVTPYLPSFTVAGFGLSDADIADIAYHNPFGAIGALCAGILTLDATAGGDAVPPTAYSAGLGPYSQSLQGATMSTLVIPNVYRCAIQAVCGGRQVVNVIGLRGSSAGQEVAAANALQTAWENVAGPLKDLPSTYALTGYYVVDLSTSSGGIANVASTNTGGITASAISTRAASALIKWNGGTRNKSSR